jgi:hypothetical protein
MLRDENSINFCVVGVLIKASIVMEAIVEFDTEMSYNKIITKPSTNYAKI